MVNILKKKLELILNSNSLIPQGFKDHVSFDTNVEHEYKNKIIDFFISNGFDLVKSPLLEFFNNENDNCFVIEEKKNEPKLIIRDDITPQIIRIASSRLKNKTRPIKLCYYGEVIRKTGTMLRPERQFLQVGSEIIGTKNIFADIEIITLAYQSLSRIGVKNITIELTSKIFLEEIFSRIDNVNLLNKLKNFIKQKDNKNSLALVSNDQDRTLLEHLFSFTGNSDKFSHNIHDFIVSDRSKKEIENINIISSNINLKKEDQFIFDFTDIDNKNYHNGIKFTFFAKNVRGEIASGGRYTLKNNDNDEMAVGFTCFMDTVLRASSFENMTKKILIPFATHKDIKNDLIKKKYNIYSLFEDESKIENFAKKYFCTHYLKNNKIKKI